MSAATILFTDIVGFSRKPSAEQLRLVKALKALVADELGPPLNAPAATRNVVALPTGDGVALAFLHLPERPWNLEKILRLILGVQTWAGRETGVSLRVGVHVGVVELVTDINGNSNVCGDTINYAQRVMDAANPKQVLFSDAAFREYIGAESRRRTVLLKALSGAKSACTVLLGGSWTALQRDARSAFRGRLVPDYFNDDVDFRVVVSLANSEF